MDKVQYYYDDAKNNYSPSNPKRENGQLADATNSEIGYQNGKQPIEDEHSVERAGAARLNHKNSMRR